MKTQTLNTLTVILAELTEIAQSNGDLNQQIATVTVKLPTYAEQLLNAMCDKVENKYTLKLDLRSAITQLEDKAEGFYSDVCDGETHQPLDDIFMEIVDALADGNEHCFTTISILAKKANDVLDALTDYSENEFDWQQFALETCESEIEDANNELPSILEDVQEKLQDALAHTENDAFDRVRYDIKQLIADTDNVIGQLDECYSDYCEEIQSKTLQGFFDDAVSVINDVLFGFVAMVRPLCVAEFEQRTNLKNRAYLDPNLDKATILQRTNAELSSQIDELKKQNNMLQTLVKGLSDMIQSMKDGDGF